MAQTKGPNIPDLETLKQAGIEPKTRLPIKQASSVKKGNAKEGITTALRIIDEEDAINRYTWYGLSDITGQELERLLYYHGQLCIFYNENLNKFFYLPYALDGSIDIYSRFQSVHPVPLGTSKTKDEQAREKELGTWLSTVNLDVLYDIVPPNDLTLEMLTKCTALLHDYSPQRSQTIIPRQQINETFIDLESDCLPFMRTALLNGTGVRGIRVNNSDEAANIFGSSDAINQAALHGEKFVPIVGQFEFQDFTDGSVAKAEEFLLAMQSLDNIRLSTLGLENGGIYRKKAHELQSEANMAGASANFVLQDGLKIRQHWCNIINSVWGLGYWCEISEAAAGIDKNLDGEVSDEQDGQELPVDNAAPAQEEVTE